jgi:integrase
MTIYRRGMSKIYTANFTIQGKRYNFSTGCHTRREAKAVEAAERKKILKQSKQSPEEKRAKTLLLDAIDNVYETRWKHTKDSQRSYKRAVNLATITGNIPLADITDTVILHLTKTLESRGSKNATINRYLSNLKTILKDHKQPVDGIKLRNTSNGRIRVLSKEEEVKIVNLFRETEHDERRYYFADMGDLVEVLVDTGMRLGEALALTYEDVDFENNLLTIWISKNGKARSIPLTKRTRSILHTRHVSNPVKPFSMKSYQVSTAWNWARKEMELEQDEQFVPHALRHTCASRMVNKGVDPMTVMTWMGHADISTTMIYMHLDPTKLVSAVSALED